MDEFQEIPKLQITNIWQYSNYSLIKSSKKKMFLNYSEFFVFENFFK